MGREIRQVWRNNFREEMELMVQSAQIYPFAAVDTEFPGFLEKTPRYAPEAKRYEDMKYNVDNLKIIQLGITLFGRDGKFATWEFNFGDFDEQRDLHSRDSIALLKQHGVDLDRNRREGIDSMEFTLWMNKRLLHRKHGLQFVFFHGLYDLGYLMKALLGGVPLPDDAGQFWKMSKHRLHHIYDTKFMAGQCFGAKVGEFGLERLGKVLNVERQGMQHQAGSDSLVTASVFLELKKACSLMDEDFDGILYSIDTTCRQKLNDMKREYWAKSLARPSYSNVVIPVCYIVYSQ